MDFKSVVKGYNEEKKDMVVKFAKLNKHTMHLNNEYHSGALNTFFNLWHTHFPHINQSKSCASCRKAVCQFFHNVANYIISEREIPEVLEQVEKAAQPKTKRTKKSKANGKTK